MDYIVLEYKDQGMSGAAGRVAVWLFATEAEARAKFYELRKTGLALALYTATPVMYFHVHQKEVP